ncbi:MAG: twin-arginine translocase TatA/TatE family subunit [Dehalococcoidia bacterium]|nr:twin-arginine translocase TatA/TatE family subunit [Dehalococcoidia bacterium]
MALVVLLPQAGRKPSCLHGLGYLNARHHGAVMEFLGMGALEIAVILIVAFIVFGPKKLPEIARNLGKAMRAFRKAAFELTAEVTKEFEEDENKTAKGDAEEKGADQR